MTERAPRSDRLLGPTSPLTPPLYQSAVYTLPDLDALERVSEGAEPGFIYARDAHPNGALLGAELATLEGASWGLVCGSGMAAVTAAATALLRQGDRVVASDRLYGRTTQLLGPHLGQFGVQTEFVDVTNLGAVESALRKPTRLLFVETISNPLLRVADVPGLAELAHEAGCLFAVDNTFATPALFRPLEHGADLVLESLTKMIGGHSDVTLGLLAGNDAEVQTRAGQASTTWGLAPSPFECWLAARGLHTLGLRVKVASANAAALADWLADRPQVVQVVYPSREDHPDRALAERLLPDGRGNMLCFEIDGGREGVNRFLRRAKGVPFSPSLGHATTTCSHPASTSHRYLNQAERERLGIGDGLVRLSVGVEEVGKIQEKLAAGLR